MPTDEKDAPTLLKEISAIVLWSHVIAAGVLGYFFFTREEEAAARLHDEDMRRERPRRASSRRRACSSCRRRSSRTSCSTRSPTCGACSRPTRRRRTRCSSTCRATWARCCRACARPTPRSGHELALALAYLSVQQIRMGSRLDHPHRRARSAGGAAVPADDAGHARGERDPPRPQSAAGRRRGSHPGAHATDGKLRRAGDRHRRRALRELRARASGSPTSARGCHTLYGGKRAPPARAESGARRDRDHRAAGRGPRRARRRLHDACARPVSADVAASSPLALLRAGWRSIPPAHFAHRGRVRGGVGPRQRARLVARRRQHEPRSRPPRTSSTRRC